MNNTHDALSVSKTAATDSAVEHIIARLRAAASMPHTFDTRELARNQRRTQIRVACGRCCSHRRTTRRSTDNGAARNQTKQAGKKRKQQTNQTLVRLTCVGDAVHTHTHHTQHTHTHNVAATDPTSRTRLRVNIVNSMLHSLQLSRAESGTISVIDSKGER